jgi:hypothetical protein
MNEIKTVACEIAYRDEPENQFWVNIALGSWNDDDEDDNDIFFYAQVDTKEDLMRLYNQDTSNEEWYIVDTE